MEFSPEREAELVEQNMPKIYRAVDNFMARYNNKRSNPIAYDDFVQEVSIVFLNYIRKCKTEEQLEMFPWYDAMHAMSSFVLQSQPLSVPNKNATKEFSNIIHSIPGTVSYEVMIENGMEIDGMSKHWVPDKETELDFSSFMSDKDEIVQRIAAMRMYGMTLREIADQCGVCYQNIDRKIKKLRSEYDEFDKEDDEDE